MAYTYKWGVILTTYTYKSWDDPPRIGSKTTMSKLADLRGMESSRQKMVKIQKCLKPPSSFLLSFPFQRWQKQRPTGTKSHPQQMTQVHHVMCHMFIQIINEVYFLNSHFVFHQTWNIQSSWEVYPILCDLSLGITVYASTLIIPTRLSRIPHPVETFQTTLAGHTGWQKNQPSLMEKKTWTHDIHLTQNVESIIRWLQKMRPVQQKTTHFFGGGVRMVSWRHQNKLLCRVLFLFSVIGLLSVVCLSPTNNP